VRPCEREIEPIRRAVEPPQERVAGDARCCSAGRPAESAQSSSDCMPKVRGQRDSEPAARTPAARGSRVRAASLELCAAATPSDVVQERTGSKTTGCNNTEKLQTSFKHDESFLPSERTTSRRLNPTDVPPRARATPAHCREALARLVREPTGSWKAGSAGASAPPASARRICSRAAASARLSYTTYRLSSCVACDGSIG